MYQYQRIICLCMWQRVSTFHWQQKLQTYVWFFIYTYENAHSKKFSHFSFIIWHFLFQKFNFSLYSSLSDMKKCNKIFFQIMVYLIQYNLQLENNTGVWPLCLLIRSIRLGFAFHLIPVGLTWNLNEIKVQFNAEKYFLQYIKTKW